MHSEARPKQKIFYQRLLNSTLTFYGKDVTRRAVERSTCSYFTDDGRKCAVGRCLLYPERFKDFQGSISGLVKSQIRPFLDPFQVRLDRLMKPNYKGFDIHFWDLLQQLHDTNNYWQSNGLSEEGGEFVREINIWINENIIL